MIQKNHFFTPMVSYTINKTIKHKSPYKNNHFIRTFLSTHIKLRKLYLNL